MATYKYWDEEGDEYEWTDMMNLPQGADLDRKEFIQQFYDAILERAYLAPAYESSVALHALRGDGTTESPVDWDLTAADGDNPLQYAHIAAMQSTLEGICSAYLIRSTFSYAFQEYSIHGPTLYTERSFTGLVFHTADPATTSDSWRRKVVRDWPVFFGGRCQEGDIIGPWIFEDLRRAIYVLRDILCEAGNDDLLDRMESPAAAMNHLSGVGRMVQFSTSCDEQWHSIVGNDVGSPFLVEFASLASTGPGSPQAEYSNVAGKTVQVDADRDPSGTDGVSTKSFSGSVSIPAPTSQGLFMAGYCRSRFDIPDMVSTSVTGSSNAMNWSTVHYSGPLYEGACSFDYWLYVHPNFAYL